MSVKNRLYEKKFAKLIKQISDYPSVKKGKSRRGRFYTVMASKHRSPAGVKIARIITMRSTHAG